MLKNDRFEQLISNKDLYGFSWILSNGPSLNKLESPCFNHFTKTRASQYDLNEQLRTKQLIVVL